jgi:uncharacterized protein (TIGR00661 family)
MKILYGIQCTGNGHITRSIKVINRMKKLGHEVHILLSGKNYNVDFPFEVKWRFSGFTFFNTKNGGIDYLKTVFSFDFLNFLKDITINVNEYDKVISDFEPITAWACRINNKKCYGLSNQYSFISDKTPRVGRSIIGETILKWMAPVEEPIGLHFKKYDDFINLPIISNDIIRFKTHDRGHYTIYLPAYDIHNILASISNINNEFHIFSDVKTTYRFKNSIIYPIDKTTFTNSFLNSHGIITNAGFQTSSEALYLSKKLMVIPTKGQYEQECNVKALKDMGIFTGRLSDLKSFLNSDKMVFDKWEDPTDEIIKMILD